MLTALSHWPLGDGTLKSLGLGKMGSDSEGPSKDSSPLKQHRPKVGGTKGAEDLDPA